MEPRNFYANSTETGFTENFFLPQPGEIKKAQLACPFFTYYEPIKRLVEEGYDVSLLVRFCSITSPSALQKALGDGVSIRYYDEDEFHTKFYIIGHRALVGSANLTRSGLTSNREASVVFERGTDPRFERLVELFDNLWGGGAVTLNQNILDGFEKTHKKFKDKQRQRESGDGDKEFNIMMDKEGVPHSSLRTINVDSGKRTKQEAFLEEFRRMYEELLHNYQEIEEIYKSMDGRHPQFEKVGADFRVEIFFFLGWVKSEKIPDPVWKKKESFKILDKNERRDKILNFIRESLSSDPSIMKDTSDPRDGVLRSNKIKENFKNEDEISKLSEDEFFETLFCCHAFSGQQRRVSGGKEGLRKEFYEKNDLGKTRETISYLLHDRQDELALRVYNCIHKDDYKLARFGPASVMELVGWSDSTALPVNSRVIKSMCFFGFDVQEAIKSLNL